MSAAPVVLLVCAYVWSTIALDQVYVSPDNGHSCPSESTCHNLSYYISRSQTYFTSNTIIIFMNGKHQLDKQEPVMVVGADNLTLEGQGEWIAGPEENVMQSTAVIRCTSGKGGFTFINSSSITIKGLTFLTCGTKSYPHDILYNRNVFDARHFMTPYAAILVMNVKQFKFHQNYMQDNTGFGLLVYQCDEVKVSNSSFFNKSRLPDGVDITDCGMAGFLWFSFTNTVLLKISYSNFTQWGLFSGCGLQNAIYVRSENKQMLNAEFSHLMCNTAESGTASCIYADLFDRSASFQITNSILKHGTYTSICIFANRASSFNLTFSENQLLNNSGTNLVLHCPIESTAVVIEKSQFSQTLVKPKWWPWFAPEYGIAIYDCNNVKIQNLQVQLQGFRTSVKISASNSLQRANLEIYKSNFTGNKNTQSTIYIKFKNNIHHGTFSNCYFSNNSNGLSVITVKNSHLTFLNCTISSNNMTGITLMENGFVEFQALNRIQNNRASEGAGIKLLPNAQINLNGILWIYNNIAYQGAGGGIYQISNLQNLPSDSNYATIFYLSGTINFLGNRATKGGSDAYGMILSAPGLSLPSENKILYSNLVNYFHFHDTDPLSSMSTDPVMVCFCNTSSHLPQCSERTHHTSTYPGIGINTTIATLGYYGGTSPGTMLVNVDNATLVHYYGQKLTVKCFTIHILLANPTPTSALVDIGVMGGLTKWTVSIRVDMLECPLGFYEDQGVCKCVPLLVTNNVHCNVSHGPSFSRTGNSWFTYLNDSQCITGVNICPFDYCNQSNISFDLTTPNHQCVGDRTGILCGQCHSGLSLMLGSNRCASCSNYYLLLLPVFALVGIVLVAILMFLNLTVSVGTINGLLFYANMIKLNEAFFFSSGSVPVVSQFIAWLNLDLGIEVCLFDGLDGYWKTWLQFAFPLYLFLLTTGIIIVSHYSVKISRLCGSHAVPALATLFLMSYTKILRTATDALSMSQLTCGNSMLTVWSVDGNIAYGSGKHLALVIFSCGVLVIGLAYPALVLCAPLLEKYSDKCIPHRWNPVPTFKPLLDAYGGPYKDRYRFWTGVTLLLRLIVTIIFSFTFGELIKINMFIINTIILGILVSWVFTSAVYRNVYLSILDVIFLANLFLLSNVCLATSLYNNVAMQTLEKGATIVSIIFSIICFVIILSMHFRQKMQSRRVKCLTRNTRSNIELPQLAKDDDEGVHETVPGSPPDQVYGTERGQHRFVFEFPRPDVAVSTDSTSCSPVLMEREPLLFDD